MEPVSGTRLRGLIRDYTRLVVTDEWPIQARTGAASEKARAAGLEMFRTFGAIRAATRQADAAIDQLQLNLIAQVQADRNRRTLQAQEFVSPVIWAVALANGLLVIIMSFFLYPDRDWPHVIMSAMLAAMVAMLIYVVSSFSSRSAGCCPCRPTPSPTRSRCTTRWTARSPRFRLARPEADLTQKTQRQHERWRWAS
jgi:ABC-type multidrug transport system fused ATPase/permease subunit